MSIVYTGQLHWDKPLDLLIAGPNLRVSYNFGYSYTFKANIQPKS